MSSLFAAIDNSFFLVLIVLVMLPVVGGFIKMFVNKRSNDSLEKNEEALKQDMLTYGALATIQATFTKGDANFKHNYEYQLYASDKMLTVKELETGDEAIIDYDNIEQFKLTKIKEKEMSNPAFGGSRPVDHSKFMVDMIYTADDKRKWHPLFCINSHQGQVNFNDYMNSDNDIFEVVSKNLKQLETIEK